MSTTTKSVIYSVLVVFLLLFGLWYFFRKEIVTAVLTTTGKSLTDRQTVVDIIKDVINEPLSKLGVKL